MALRSIPILLNVCVALSFKNPLLQQVNLSSKDEGECDLGYASVPGLDDGTVASAQEHVLVAGLERHTHHLELVVHLHQLLPCKGVATETTNTPQREREREKGNWNGRSVIEMKFCLKRDDVQLKQTNVAV